MNGKAAEIAEGNIKLSHWSADVQKRLIAVGKDQDSDVQNLMAEAACLLAAADQHRTDLCEAIDAWSRRALSPAVNDLPLALQDAYEKAAQTVESLHPYVFAGHMNDYRRNKADAARAIRSLKDAPTATSVATQPSTATGEVPQLIRHRDAPD
jgi:hypothetical protein